MELLKSLRKMLARRIKWALLLQRVKVMKRKSMAMINSRIKKPLS